MTSELEKMAEEYAREDCEYYQARYHAFLFGAKAFLEFARRYAYLDAKPFEEKDYQYVSFEDLEKFVEGEK